MSICLAAFDFGTTTVKAVLASAELSHNVVTGRTELRALHNIYRPEPVFTPYLDGLTPSGRDASGVIDAPRLNAIVDEWLKRGLAMHKSSQALLAGGVIVTGLAAKSENAAKIAEAVRARLGDAMVAIADEPGYESWLAFMGSCGSLSAASPENYFLNFDIGGGTTNLALGRDKAVFTTGSLWVGGRHFQFESGSFRLKRVSHFGQKILQLLELSIAPGDELSHEQLQEVVRFYVKQLERLIQPSAKIPNFLWQLPFRLLRPSQKPVLTFSGGVGELVYRLAQGEDFGVTPYGDLGVELAQGIVASPILSAHLKDFVPPHQGRATVSGLAFHGVEASGATIYIKDQNILPLRDIPLLGRVFKKTTVAELNGLLLRAQVLPEGAALLVELGSDADSDLRAMAAKLSGALHKNSFAKTKPLIIFLRENLGKTFGHYVTNWGREPFSLVVVDEIDRERITQNACFVSVHPSGEKNVLVSFYGGVE